MPTDSTFKAMLVDLLPIREEFYTTPPPVSLSTRATWAEHDTAMFATDHDMCNLHVNPYHLFASGPHLRHDPILTGLLFQLAETEELGAEEAVQVLPAFLCDPDHALTGAFFYYPAVDEVLPLGEAYMDDINLRPTTRIENLVIHLSLCPVPSLDTIKAFALDVPWDQAFILDHAGSLTIDQHNLASAILLALLYAATDKPGPTVWDVLRAYPDMPERQQWHALCSVAHLMGVRANYANNMAWDHAGRVLVGDGYYSKGVDECTGREPFTLLLHNPSRYMRLSTDVPLRVTRFVTRTGPTFHTYAVVEFYRKDLLVFEELAPFAATGNSTVIAECHSCGSHWEYNQNDFVGDTPLTSALCPCCEMARVHLRWEDLNA